MEIDLLFKIAGIGIIIAYSRSRKRVGQSLICGKFGQLPFQLIVILGSIMATVGSVITVR